MKYFVLGMSLLILAACGNNQQSAPGTNVAGEFLPVEKAFVFSSDRIDDQTLKLNWVIAEGYHLYKNKFQFTLTPDTARIANIDMPKGIMLDDKTFGRQEAYKHNVDILVKLKPQNEIKNIKLTTKYQGCSEKGLCYPPEERTVEIAL